MFALQALDVSCMRTYKDALELYTEIKASKNGYKYLSKNKELTIDIHKDFSIGCSYKSNECVKYRPDGVIELDACGWVTPSTSTFIGACTGIQCHCSGSKLYARIIGPDGMYGDYVFGRPRVKDGVILNPVQERRRLVDKKKAKEIRARFKPFRDRLLAILPAITYSALLDERLLSTLRPTDRWETFIGLRDIAALIPNDNDEYALAYFTFHSNADVGKAKSLLCRMYEELYRCENAFVYEDVPLGEIAKRDTI